jgi:nucleoside 2-deoxyribosyltransferase
MKRIYLAGPLFTSAEREWNVRLARLLEKGGLEIWLPQEHEPRKLTAQAIFDMDVKGIDWADIVVGIMDGPDPDSGTSWEIGYAYAKNMRIVLVRTDFRGVGEAGLSPYNLMLSQSANTMLNLPFSSVDKVAGVMLDLFSKLWELP